MNSDLKGLDPAAPNYPLWVRMTAFLSTLCETMTELQVIVRGDGNGEKGLLQRMIVIEGAVQVSQSDIKEVLTTMRHVYGMDSDEMGNRFSKDNHPERRVTDEQSTFDKVLKYVVDKILPPVIVWVLLGWLAFTLAVNQHIILTK